MRNKAVYAYRRPQTTQLGSAPLRRCSSIIHLQTVFGLPYISIRQHKDSVGLSAVAGVAGLGYILWSIYQRVQRRRLPTSWGQVGTLSDLLAYPVKSCQWVELQEAECTNMGLRDGWMRDRTLMVINKNGKLVSASTYPEMLRVKSCFDGLHIKLTHPNMEPLLVDLEETRKAPTIKATMWSTPVHVHSCGWESSEWFSRLLRKDADSMRLVYYSAEDCRPLGFNANPILIFRKILYRKDDTGSFPVETAYNLINEASVEDMNRRIDSNTPVSAWVHQFRPNFVLKGAEPLVEDDWKYIKIGDNIFEITEPCTRCIMTTIDPETATRDPNGEPLATLKSYRQVTEPTLRKSVGSSPRMGLQLALRSPPGGRVKLGDRIYAPRTQQVH